MSNLVKWRPVKDAEQRIDEAIERIVKSRISGRPPQRIVTVHVNGPAPGEIVDLPRVCSVHEKPYVARYVMAADGRFHHSQTIRVTESLWECQYQGNENTRAVPGDDLDFEACPWCGAHSVGWIGPVNCSECGAKVCFGRTVKDYFRCRPGCPGEGYLMVSSRMENGVIPSLRRFGGSGTI